MLSNFKKQKGEINSHPSPEKPQQDELNWEDGWTQLEDGVYYRVVPASTEDQPFHLIKGDKVKVDPDVINKKAMPAANSTLTFTAYAIQTENLEPAAAWAAVKNP